MFRPNSLRAKVCLDAAPNLVGGIWACLVTLAGAYGGVYWRQQAASATAASAHEEKL